MIEKYLNHQSVDKSVKDNTLRDQRSKLKIANEWKHISEWSKDDVTEYILYLKKERYSTGYVENVKSLIKSFFIFHDKQDYVEKLKVKVEEKKLKKNEILTPADVDKLIEVATDNRYKALVALLFESGGRISEILNIKVKDIEETKKGMVIMIPATKTGEEYRPCACTNSAQYIRNHILYPSLKKNDFLFDISKVQVWLKLKEFGKLAGIDKPISAHRLRHAQATYMVRKGYNETIIRSKLGWKDDSAMIARYVHIDGLDVLNATYEKEGQEIVISPELTENIKLASPIAIADPSLEFQRINQENEQLKQRSEDQAAIIRNTRAEMEKMKSEQAEQQDFIMRTLKAKGII
jgi:integrase/recombinase XerD